MEGAGGAGGSSGTHPRAESLPPLGCDVLHREAKPATRLNEIGKAFLMREGIAAPVDIGGLLLYLAADRASLEEPVSLRADLESNVVDKGGEEVKFDHPEGDGGHECEQGSEGPVEPEGGCAENPGKHSVVLEERAVKYLRVCEWNDGKPGDDTAPDKKVHDGSPVERVHSNLSEGRGQDYRCCYTKTRSRRQHVYSTVE